MQTADGASFRARTVTIKIDRPLGSQHPKFEWKDPANHGHVPGTLSGDGEELDAKLFGTNERMEPCKMNCVVVLRRLGGKRVHG